MLGAKVVGGSVGARGRERWKETEREREKGGRHQLCYVTVQSFINLYFVMFAKGHTLQKVISICKVV